MKISPSILASDFANLKQEMAAMEAAGAEMIHLDVMDGHFVPNITFGPPVIAGLRKSSGMFFDVHLMISEPLRYVEAFVKAGSDMITFHLESEGDPARTIRCIRESGRMAGIALKPSTPASAALPYLQAVDMILVMTVEPGFGGQGFMEDQMDKLSRLRDACRRHKPELLLQVDGGIDTATAPIAAKNGANVLVAGSALFGRPDYAAAVNALRDAALAAVS